MGGDTAPTTGMLCSSVPLTRIPLISPAGQEGSVPGTGGEVTEFSSNHTVRTWLRPQNVGSGPPLPLLPLCVSPFLVLINQPKPSGLPLPSSPRGLTAFPSLGYLVVTCAKNGHGRILSPEKWERPAAGALILQRPCTWRWESPTLCLATTC